MSGETPSPRPGAADRGMGHLWRGVDVFRVAGLCYASVVYAGSVEEMRRPLLGWAVLLGMACWTAYLLVRRSRPTWLVLTDVLVGLLAVLSSRAVQPPELIADGAPTIPSFWVAAPVLSAAVAWGWRGGLAAGVVIGAGDIVVVQNPTYVSIHNIVLLILAGGIIGYAVALFRAGQGMLDEAIAREAATRERERLARDIHDSVLQVLAYVKRRGAEVGGEAAEIGLLAGEQEQRLRALVATGPDARSPRADGGWGRDDGDLRRALGAFASGSVTVSGPAEPVPLPTPAAEAVTAAVREALVNVQRHGGPGTQAWVLLEDDGERVTVSVRDDGPGIPAGRLEAAEASGRLGVRSSIKGRIAEVGGEVVIVSAPGEGTEIELRVPRGGPA